jgi:hypothetical protein
MTDRDRQDAGNAASRSNGLVSRERPRKFVDHVCLHQWQRCKRHRANIRDRKNQNATRLELRSCPASAATRPSTSPRWRGARCGEFPTMGRAKLLYALSCLLFNIEATAHDHRRREQSERTLLGEARCGLCLRKRTGASFFGSQKSWGGTQESNTGRKTSPPGSWRTGQYSVTGAFRHWGDRHASAAAMVVGLGPALGVRRDFGLG